MLTAKTILPNSQQFCWNKSNTAVLKETGDEIGPRTWPLPAGLAENKDPQVRELAFAAQKYGAAGIKDPGDFEAIYNHGLALQELALRCSGSRESQEHLLRQVNRKQVSVRFCA